jgi:predicted secreted protein
VLVLCVCVQAAEAARSALSQEQAKTLKLETQVAELTEKLGSVQVRDADSSH